MYFVDDADAQNWTRIVLFHAVEHADPVLLGGEPVDPSIDVGLAISSQPPKAQCVENEQSRGRGRPFDWRDLDHQDSVLSD